MVIPSPPLTSETHTFAQLDYANATFQTRTVDGRDTAVPSLVNRWRVTQIQPVNRKKQKAGSIQGMLGGLNLQKSVFFFIFLGSRVSSLRA